MDKPSKSARKRDAQAIEQLGERLLALADEQLAGIPLDDELRGIVITTRNMRARSALRRQRLYLAKSLRQRDLSAIMAALQQLDRQGSDERKLFHQAERWRDRLVQQGDEALSDFASEVGGNTATLEKLLGELRPSLPDAVRRRLQRDIFREVRRILAE